MAVAIEPIWTLGNRLWRARIEAKLEQADIARELGVSRQLVGRWEHDLSEPTVGQVRRWSELTGVSLTWLVVTVGELLCELHAEPGCPLCSPAELAMTYSPAMSRAS